MKKTIQRRGRTCRTRRRSLRRLKAEAKPENVEGMAGFGITTDRRLGVSVPDMRKLEGEISRDHVLAFEPWKTRFPEAKTVAEVIGDPERLADRRMQNWGKGFDSRDVCDRVCTNLFEKSPLVMNKIHDWSERDGDFVKRATYALIACLAWHDKEAGDGTFRIGGGLSVYFVRRGLGKQQHGHGGRVRPEIVVPPDHDGPGVDFLHRGYHR
ncbi:MAG: DNA alkylation repair protein [Deltaproteobacteria bacterium]|nr:DNA alkylation repair protein [Deltaproteobacteria bacterium]